jgi:hypothetical protein
MIQNQSVIIVSVELPPDPDGKAKQLRAKIKRTINGILRRRLVRRVNDEGSLRILASSATATTTTAATMDEDEVQATQHPKPALPCESNVFGSCCGTKDRALV